MGNLMDHIATANPTSPANIDLVFLNLKVSAIASAFVDNIPLTTMMVKIAISLSENKELGLPLQPLVWALAFGACLGGTCPYRLLVNRFFFKFNSFVLKETER